MLVAVQLSGLVLWISGCMIVVVLKLPMPMLPMSFVGRVVEDV